MFLLRIARTLFKILRFYVILLYLQLVIDLTRRLGNIRNELGVLFLNKSRAMAKNYGMPTDNEMMLWKLSYNHFDKGIKAFEFIQDK